MVVIQLKVKQEAIFNYETTTEIDTETLCRDLVFLHNYRLKIKRLINACDEIIQYGPSKPPSEHGYTEKEMEELANEQKKEAEIKKNKYGVKIIARIDPTGRRVGEAPINEMANIIKEARDHAESVVSQESVSVDLYNEVYSRIKGALMIVYPMGLPEYDPAREILDETEDTMACIHAKEILDPDHSSLWWAGKCLQKGKALKDYIGRNEKTKIVVKLEKEGVGAPLREAIMSEKEQKAMLSFYYHKQEELKKLAEDEDDHYANSHWANPKAYKEVFTGVHNISWKPK